MGQVTPLFKKEEELYKKNYRPVTVLPILNNIYERVLSDQLSVYFKDILSDFISAYRKNHSCESTLLRLTEDWRAGLDNKELVAVISLDLSKAFDCVPHELLLAKLKAYGVAEHGVALLRNYLSGRSQRVKVGDQFSSWLPVIKGVPQGSVLGPLFFNVFMNDLFYFLKEVCINAYADDEQIYASDKDPVKLEMKLQCQLLEADQWFGMNGMITNPDKYQAMILGNTNYTFSFTVNDINIPVKDNIDLLGVNIDKNLQFNTHVKNICTKVNNQINVISRFRKIVPTDVKCKLYKAFIVPYFRYCSAVWHFCGARNRNKLESLNKRALRIVLDEKSLHYQELLSKFSTSDLYSIRCQDMMKTVFKAIRFETMPKYVRGLFQMRNAERNLRGSSKLVIPYVNTTTYGLHSFRYTSANMWNKLTEDLRSLTSLNEFRAKICQISFEHQCNCYLCK